MYDNNFRECRQLYKMGTLIWLKDDISSRMRYHSPGISCFLVLPYRNTFTFLQAENQLS